MASRSARLTPRGEHAIALLAALAFGLLYWIPAASVSRGYFPAPLDDVYIHFDFARSLATGHPFEWIPGQGYSSGETSPLYAVVLAAGWLLGFRDRALAGWAAIVAVFAVASLLQSIRALLRPAPPWLAWMACLLPLSTGLVDWTLYSGMEVALFTAALGKALVAVEHARAPHAHPSRERWQWRVGAWGAALVLLRPEAAVLVAVFAVLVARRSGARSGTAALFRVGLPGALATLGVLATNYVATGDARSAGAQLKLLSSNPYFSDADRARVFAENLVTFWIKAVRDGFAARPFFLSALALACVLALVHRRRRGIAATCLIGALAWTLVVSWNANAPHHNFRYYVPALVLVHVAAAIGVTSIAAPPSPRRRALALLLGATLFAIGAPTIPRQVRHYRSACANIRGQQVEVGERLASLPANASVLLGDAGAIPFVSGRSAVDALGLGGYRRMPFARAALSGEAATIELIERLEPAARPTHFALYPNWFATLTSQFGTEIDRVTIDDNVICGSPTKGIYRADWSALSSKADHDVIDELDVGDVVSEAEHAYVSPAPHGGWATLDILADGDVARRFDGGRTIPLGTSEAFRLARSSAGPVIVRVRVDSAARGIVIRTKGSEQELEIEPARPGHWRAGRASFDHLDRGDIVTLEARASEYRSYHVWLERDLGAVRSAH